MNTPKHTPSPWYHVDGISGTYITTNKDLSKGRYIASLRANDGSNFDDLSSQETDANARLIAAAQRLLKEARQNSFNLNGNLSDTTAEEQAQAAINKAIGE